MCTAAILTVAKRWKQPKGLLMNEWVSKMWDMHTMEYYSGLHKKEIQTMLQHGYCDLLLCKIKRSYKNKYYVIPLRDGIQSSQIHTDRKNNGELWFRVHGASVR